MLVGAWVAFVIPMAMTAGFMFVHIPALDAYLMDRYGKDFKRYFDNTAKFIPYLY